jgi:hypothetical protein
MTTFKSFEGLSDRELGGVELQRLYGISDFDSERFDQLGRFYAESVGLQRLDLSRFDVGSVSLSATDIASLSLGSGTLNVISLQANHRLTGLTWLPSLRVRSFDLQDNTSLSTCLIQDFVAQTRISGGIVLLDNNGPCP